MNKNYRIHTNIISDTLLQVNMRQDFDFMEILSLKLSQKDAYKIHSSNYGVIIGRVLANDAFGIPNAKISVFIERDDNDTTDMENIYPYDEITSKDKNGRRYNLLPDDSDDECYRIVGTFPNKRLLLDDNTYLEVYDKYWKYSTVTNNAGDYMIFGVPVGSQQIHVDIDMSDIGVLSQKPRDYMYKGYTETLFESSTQFKKSTNLDDLTQIFSQNKSVYVYPFWGDADNGVAAITRADIQISYKFEPTCIFMGSIVSDNEGNIIDHKCGGSKKSGFNKQLVAGEGTIEMIRKTQDGLVEEYPIQGNRLIDSDGVWCYQIPMNLDFIGTDEYGNLVPTDNPSKGIPTRTQVRFRISKTETGSEGFSIHTAKFLVPMNPVLDEEKVIPTTKETTGQEMERMYNFGSNTPQSCFRDLYWNNVYSVKSFIPKTQTTKRGYSPYYNALKACNSVDNQNPIPFNKLMINIPFTYMFICLLYTIVVTIITVVNTMINLLNDLIALINSFLNVSIFGVTIFSFGRIGYIGCVPMQIGVNDENKVYYPGCDNRGMNAADCPEDMDSCKKVNDNDELMDVIQQNLSQEYDVVRLDLFQDWLNGCLYMPLWLWRKTKKKKFLFGLFTRSAKNEFCDCDKNYSKLKTKVTCNITYKNNSLGTNGSSVDLKENKWHKTRDKSIGFFNGLIKRVENSAGEYVYYYTAFQPSSNNETFISDIKQRKSSFEIVRLFATDIILLGNINKSNIYGIPQLFNNLPSTTSNVPPIATIEESDEAETEEEKRKKSKTYSEKDNDMIDEEEGGKTIVTGMDWGYSGADDSPIYKKGLFLDLACLYANTKSKACINVERMSELGVGLDMSYKMTYARSGSLVQGVIDSDGFINKFEINDNEARAMFATLNHVGFVPQDYQDEKGMYDTQVPDDSTNYLVPKFKYIYPIDFDGRMKPIMEEYSNGFVQPLLDNIDESYLTFRLGAEKDGTQKRLRHFYYSPDNSPETEKEMPLYNNSFYFYFGINKGNTAIDKFTSKFIAPCVKETKNPFSILAETQGKVACPEIYAIDEYKEPYIKVSLDDIQVPYSYELLDSAGNLVINEMNKLETQFRIPDATSRITRDVEISNQTYTLKVRDANGKRLTERITVSTPSITFNYETQRLGTKFYNTGATRIDNVCSDKTMTYGKIMIDSFSIDGYEFNITDVSGMSYNPDSNSYFMSISGVSNAQEEGVDIFEDSGTSIGLLISTNVLSVSDCMCDSGNTVAERQGVQNNMLSSWYELVIGDTVADNVLELYIYQPNSFMVTATQLCKDGEGWVETENTINEMIVVQNGEVFNAYLNKMPLRFMLGTISDSMSGEIMEQSKFYKVNAVEDPVDPHLKGWFGVHEEGAYKFPPTKGIEAPIWGDYVRFNDSITNASVKRKILKYKFETMFSVAEAAYVTTTSSAKYQFRGQGGVGVPLNRSLYPIYDESELKQGRTKYVLNDRSVITGNKNYPNFVGENYKGTPKYYVSGSESHPYFNSFVRTSETNSYKRQGNYLAVFSNNGGYISNKVIDNKLPVEKQPSFASVSPTSDNTIKTIGKDMKGNLNDFRPAYEKDSNRSLPYFRSMFVDRRLDFDLIIFGPAMGQKMNLYPFEYVNGKIIECGFDRVWKNARISGLTYGGIEMSYDDEYNILSATSEDFNVSAETNNELEYTYSYSDNTDEDVITVFNNGFTESENNSYWRHVNTPKRLYEASLNGADVRDGFWSTNRREEMIANISAETYIEDYGYIDDSGNTHPYFFKYPYSNILYNGYYCMESANWDYPLKRYIDVGNIPAIEGYNGMYLTSCSYDTKPIIDEYTGELKMQTAAGESIEMNFSFNDFLRMVTPDSETYTVVVQNPDDIGYHEETRVRTGGVYGNVTYVKTGNAEFGYYKLSATRIHPMFYIKPYEVDGFKVYNHTPRIVRVLPYFGYTREQPCFGQTCGFDGISYVKLSCPYWATTPGGQYEKPVRKTLDETIEEVTRHRFMTATHGELGGRYDVKTPESVGWKRLITLKNGMEINDFFFTEFESEIPLTSDSYEYDEILFGKDISNTDFTVFTVMLQREYESLDNDNLTKHIRTIETSSLFDCRDMSFRPDVYDSRHPGLQNSSIYITYQGADKFTQSLGFRFRYNINETNPSDMGCQAFFNYGAMDYSFIITAQGDTTRTFNVSANDPSYTVIEEGGQFFGQLVISCIWPEEWGIILDNEWNNKTTVNIIAKTREGFVYRIEDIKLNSAGLRSEDNVSYNPDTKKGRGFSIGQNYYLTGLMPK